MSAGRKPNVSKQLTESLIKKYQDELIHDLPSHSL